MKKADFWKHIELSKRSDPEEHEERLVKRLSKLSPSEILQFEKWWTSVHDAAYTWKLWGAAYSSYQTYAPTGQAGGGRQTGIQTPASLLVGESVWQLEPAC
jgi:hypothetical protein